jgi:23S rRNA (adenine2503-C2)-methyltransferase
MVKILQLTQKQFADQVFAILGRGKRQAEMLYTHFFRTGKFPTGEEWTEKQSLSLLDEIIALTNSSLPILSCQKEDGLALKFLLQYPDGLESESVVIAMGSGNTLCLSSQVGCRMGCAFCETGKMGLLRNLTVQEIVSQVFYARHILGHDLHNIVFMGMGEPLDNFDAVMQAIEVLTDDSGLGFGLSRITVSTSGDGEAIARFSREANPAVNLAVSVNAPTDLLRNKLMPINKKWNMEALKRAMEGYLEHPRRKILIGYVLLKEINDSLECAQQLAEYLQGLRVKINLIPYNPQSRDRFARSDPERMEVFANHLRAAGYQVLFRRSRGKEIMAACGQLGNLKLRNKLQLVK